MKKMDDSQPEGQFQTGTTHGLFTKLWQEISPRSRKWLKIVLLLAAIAVVSNVIRIYTLQHSLYSLNLNSKIPLEIMERPVPDEKFLIFAPHEDDETLGTAGLIQQATAAGAKVHIVFMTNGEYPETSVVLVEEKLPVNPREFIDLGYMRQRESLAAMKYLGLPDNSVTFLGYPNQYLDQMWLPDHWQPTQPVRSIRTDSSFSPYSNSMTPQAVYCGQSMLNDVKAVLQREKPDVVITIQPNDVHVDHWPTYSVVRSALLELEASGFSFAHRAKVFTYLIHRDEWPTPRGYRPIARLEPPTRLAELETTKWYALPLTLAQTIDKHKATALYISQGGSYDRLLLSFARANELYGVLPLNTWPTKTTVPFTEIIKDPSADLQSSALVGSGDILTVKLSRAEDSMSVSVRTRDKFSNGIKYHLTIHAGDDSEADRIIAEYDWQGDKASSHIFSSGSVYSTDSKTLLHVLRGQRVSTLICPWPLSDKATSFFLVRAWTTKGNATVDQTAVSTYVMAR